MSAETIVILSALIGSLLDLIIAFAIVGVAHVLFQLARGIEWVIVSIEAHKKKKAPTGAESEEHQ